MRYVVAEGFLLIPLGLRAAVGIDRLQIGNLSIGLVASRGKVGVIYRTFGEIHRRLLAKINLVDQNVTQSLGLLVRSQSTVTI